MVNYILRSGEERGEAEPINKIDTCVPNTDNLEEDKPAEKVKVSSYICVQTENLPMLAFQNIKYTVYVKII